MLPRAGSAAIQGQTRYRKSHNIGVAADLIGWRPAGGAAGADTLTATGDLLRRGFTVLTRVSRCMAFSNGRKTALKRPIGRAETLGRELDHVARDQCIH